MNLLDLMVKIGVDDQASSKIAGIGESVKSGLGSAAKAGAAAMGAAVIAAGTGAAALTKTALGAYSSYEQLSGGVEKLFGDASDSVMKHAQEAYRTSGMSANQYMEQATSFSAALINSLGGDTAKAAEQADVAMRAISDNVNVFGSNTQDVQNAYQGFAKQNYTMLDNLKLGYGGTKTEMERLIADANEYAAANGKAADLSIESFSDIVTAIELIQEKQNIAGTTAREAGTTIEGSVNAAKSAWQNLMTELGKPDADIGARMSELVATVFGDGTESNLGVFGNVMPAVASIVQNAATALVEATPYIQTALESYLPVVLDALSQLTPQILTVLVTVVTLIAEQLPTLVQTLVPVIIELAPVLMEAGLQMFLGILEALGEASPEITQGLIDMLVAMAALLVEYAPKMLEAAGKLMLGIIQGIVEAMMPAMEAMNKVVEGALNAALKFVGSMLSAGGQLVKGIIDGIANGVGGIATEVSNGVKGAVDTIAGFWQSMYDAGSSILGGFVDGIWAGFQGAVDAVAQGLEWVRSYLPFSPAKRGPFSGKGWTLYSGRSLMEAFGEGIEQTAGDAVRSAEAAMVGVSDAMTADFGTPGIGVGATRGAPASAAPQIVININDPVIKEEADVDRIFEYVQTKVRRQAGVWSQSYSMA